VRIASNPDVRRFATGSQFVDYIYAWDVDRALGHVIFYVHENVPLPPFPSEVAGLRVLLAVSGEIDKGTT
jgi:hypothetical protein